MIHLILLTVMISLAIADSYTTHRALSLGAIEANPVVRWMIRGTGKLWPLAKLLPLTPAFYGLWAYPRDSMVLAAVAAVALLYFIVVLNNLTVIRRLSQD